MQITMILILSAALGLVLLGFYKRKFTANVPIQLKLSKQYNIKKKRFVNNSSYTVSFPDDDNVKLGSSLWRYMFGKNQKPAFTLPEDKPNLEEFLLGSSDIKSIWFGHSSFILNFKGRVLLFDPVLSKSASPISFITTRFQKPVLALKELPKIDYIVLSHDHYDHLDMPTIKFFKNTATKFIVPLGVGMHLQRWGITKNRITELDWWQSIKCANLEFILTPAQHFSGRKIIDYNNTLWGSWVVRDANNSIFFSGDSGYAKHFQAIGDKYGPFDLVFIENGQYDPAWRDVHMLPEDVIQAVVDLKAKIFMPLHWGMFCLAPHQWFEPIENIYNLAGSRGVNLYTPKIGQLMVLGKTKTHAWWRELLINYEADAKLNTIVSQN